MEETKTGNDSPESTGLSTTTTTSSIRNSDESSNSITHRKRKAEAIPHKYPKKLSRRQFESFMTMVFELKYGNEKVVSAFREMDIEEEDNEVVWGYIAKVAACDYSWSTVKKKFSSALFQIYNKKISSHGKSFFLEDLAKKYPECYKDFELNYDFNRRRRTGHQLWNEDTVEKLFELRFQDETSRLFELGFTRNGWCTIANDLTSFLNSHGRAKIIFYQNQVSTGYHKLVNAYRDYEDKKTNSTPDHFHIIQRYWSKIVAFETLKKRKDTGPPIEQKHSPNDPNPQLDSLEGNASIDDCISDMAYMQSQLETHTKCFKQLERENSAAAQSRQQMVALLQQILSIMQVMVQK